MTHEHRKMLLFFTSSVFFPLACMIGSQLYFGGPRDTAKQIGSVLGLVLGLLASIYVKATWQTRIARGQQAIDNPPRSSCLVPFVTALGLVVGGTLLTSLQWNVIDVFASAIVYFWFIFSGFVMIKTFMEKAPKK